ncbi:golgin subfamily A member 6-like protein 22 [Scomber scombrus]|uniref:Golgin subfamily A member 6-like protein 22 n=1 Tax=Scomber scombrus TaxID=13677 RepID=A0AAV1NG88_SCOSC
MGLAKMHIHWWCNPTARIAFLKSLAQIGEKHKVNFHENTTVYELTDEMEPHQQNTSREVIQAGCKLCEERGNKEYEEKLRSPKQHQKETQTLCMWQDIEEVKNVFQQEQQAWREEEKSLFDSITGLTRDKAALQQEMDRIIKEAKMQLKALYEEMELLFKENVILKKQKHAEENEKEAMQVNEARQGEIQEVQMLLQNEKQQSDMNEASARAHTWEDALTNQLEEMEAVHCFDEILLEKQKQELEALREKVRGLEDLLQWARNLCTEQGVQDLRSAVDSLSIRQRIVRIFIPRWTVGQKEEEECRRCGCSPLSCGAHDREESGLQQMPSLTSETAL